MTPMTPMTRVAGRTPAGRLAALLVALSVLLAPAAAQAGNNPGGGPNNGGGATNGGGSNNGGGFNNGGGSAGGTNGGSTSGDGADQGQPGGNENPVTSGQNSRQNYSGCTLYANQNSFGALCGTASTNGGRTWREILAGDPFPNCRYTSLPAGFDPPLTPHGQAGRWVVETCLSNVTIDGVAPGQTVNRRTQLVFFPAGKVVPGLTPRQLEVWNSMASDYPTPIVLTGPVDPPRVRVPTTFWLSVTGEDAQRAHRATITDGGAPFSTLEMTTVAANNTPMRAFVARTFVWPGVAANEQPKMCPGAGAPRANAADPVAANECAYTYSRTSAWIPGDRYQLTIEADWVVEYQSADGQWHGLGQVPVTTQYLSVVDEIQTVND